VPDQTLALEDVVASVFGVSGSGAIFWRVVGADPDFLLVSANTYNRVDAVQRYGQQIPGVRWSDAGHAATHVLVPALAGRYRTNLGFATGADCTIVAVTGFDRSGALVAQRTLAVQPWSWVQLNSLFEHVFPDLLPNPATRRSLKPAPLPGQRRGRTGSGLHQCHRQRDQRRQLLPRAGGGQR
jgi:hypothetical protein